MILCGIARRIDVESDFAAAQVHLRNARLCLGGGDKVSEEATEALDLLIVAAVTAELTRSHGKVIPFRNVSDREPPMAGP